MIRAYTYGGTVMKGGNDIETSEQREREKKQAIEEN